ncbi:hypothetical protein KHHGKMAE_1229 [Methylobacterium persicinum]|nr:hypothetical protein KHHGKMAE_1229 [Methylobacterium persicinum]
MDRLSATRHRMYRRIEAMQIEIALMRIGLAFRAFNPSQRRVPAGHPDGGQWTSENSSESAFGDNDGRVFFVSDGSDRNLTVDLRAEEGRGGHTVGRHIGKSDDELFEKVRQSQWRTLAGHGGLRRAGSFPSLETAHDLVNKTIILNQSAVAPIIAGTDDRVFIKHTFGSPTGREAYSTNDQVVYTRDTYSVGVELRRDPRLERVFYVRTAYPFTVVY